MLAVHVLYQTEEVLLYSWVFWEFCHKSVWSCQIFLLCQLIWSYCLFSLSIRWATLAPAGRARTPLTAEWGWEWGSHSNKWHYSNKMEEQHLITAPHVASTHILGRGSVGLVHHRVMMSMWLLEASQTPPGRSIWTSCYNLAVMGSPSGPSWRLPGVPTVLSVEFGWWGPLWSDSFLLAGLPLPGSAAE